MGKKEGRKYSRLKNPKYWRSMGPKGHTSATAVINEYEKLNSRIQRIGAEYDQATDETERDETAKRIKAWQQVKKDIESDDHLRSIINRE
jgi:hypothetical protein